MKSSRERILAFTVVGIVSLFALHAILDSLLLGPARTLNEQTTQLEAKVSQLERENALAPAYRNKLRQWYDKTYSDDESVAKWRLHQDIALRVDFSGLESTNLNIKPITGSRKPRAYTEVGWSISIKGTVDTLVDFMYLLMAMPQLQRLERVVLTSVPKTGELDLNLDCTTLVLIPDKTDQWPVMVVQDLAEPAGLNEPVRELYQVIAKRDLFRPYVQAPPPPPPPVRPVVTAKASPPPPPPPPPTEYKIVGLPSGGGKQAIFLQDSQQGQVLRLEVGQNLPGAWSDARIVGVDYRKMPRPDNPLLSSGSRLIFEREGDLWAAELGTDLSSGRRLSDEELPIELRSKIPPDERVAQGRVSDKRN